MKKLLLIPALLIVFSEVEAQTVTYSQHVAPILYNHCTKCHRAGEVGPFTLTSYADAQAWSSMIKYTTGIGYMPPWKAEVGYQDYLHENFLTQAEIQTIADWVDQGAVQGDPNLEPPLPIFPTGSQVGLPDAVVSFSQAYTHVGNNLDEYRFFVLPTGITTAKDLVALEVRPGNNRIVHHTLIWSDTTGSAAAADAATPEYGYGSQSGSGIASLDNQLPGYVPGQKPNVYTQGIAMRLPPNTDLKLQMHYAPSSTDEVDSTTVNLFFAEEPATRFVQSKVLLPLPSVLTNGPFVITANTVKEFHGRYTVPIDVSIIGIAPHCHMLGQHWIVYAVKPTGDTVNLIKINDWDFNWQGTYSFKQLIPLPAGTVIHAYAEYDNTSNNPLNPNNPPIDVTWGENTSDEMYYLPILYLSYQQGDENVVFEESVGINDSKYYMVKDKLYPVSPNPASDKVKVGFTLGQGGNLNVKLFNSTGQLVKTIVDNLFYLPGLHSTEIDLSRLAAGVYSLELEKGTNKQSQKIVISK